MAATSEGSLRLAFQRRGATTALDVLHQAGAAAGALSQARGAGRVPRRCWSTPPAGSRAATGSTSSVTLAEATSLTVTTAAAEKIYRAREDEAAIRVGIDLKAGARLAWLPQPTILFDRRALRSPHRGRSRRRCHLSRRRDPDLRPRGHGRGRPPRLLPRRLARAPRRQARLRRQPAARRRHRRHPRSAAPRSMVRGPRRSCFIAAAMRRLAWSRRVRYWKGRGARWG